MIIFHLLPQSGRASRFVRGLPGLIGLLLLMGLGAESQAAIQCERTLVANIVALDQPLMFNRLGAQNVNGMMFALRNDVVDAAGVLLSEGGAAVPGQVSLRPDKRPRPLVLRVAAGDCLTVNLHNLLAFQANPNGGGTGEHVDDQVSDRHVGFEVTGMQALGSISDIAANVNTTTTCCRPGYPA